MSIKTLMLLTITIKTVMLQGMIFYILSCDEHNNEKSDYELDDETTRDILNYFFLLTKTSSLQAVRVG